MSELMKQLRKQTLVIALAYLAIGLLFVCIPDITANAVAILVAAALLIFGVIRMTAYFARRGSGLVDRSGLPIGLLLVIAAIIFFIKPSLLVSIVYIILGLGIVVNGTLKLQAGIELKNDQRRYWAGVVIAAVVAIILGLIVVFAPFSTAKAVTVMIGVSMILCAAFDIVSAIFFIK